MLIIIIIKSVINNNNERDVAGENARYIVQSSIDVGFFGPGQAIKTQVR